VQVSYDSDVERALALMEEAARAQAAVLKAPQRTVATLFDLPRAALTSSWASWINDPENGQGNLKSALNLAILRLFRGNEIRIPYPKRELNIVGGLEALSPFGPRDRPEGS
jgi:small-conductance mechanosensitive channel